MRRTIKKIVGKVLKGLELADRKDNKLTIIKLEFSMGGYDRLTEKEIHGLSETAQDFFHLIHNFGRNEKITNFVNVWMLEEQYNFHNNLRTLSDIFLQEFVFFRQGQQVAQLQNTYKRCPRNITERTVFVRPRKQRTHNKRIHRTKTNTSDMAHID